MADAEADFKTPPVQNRYAGWVLPAMLLVAVTYPHLFRAVGIPPRLLIAACLIVTIGFVAWRFNRNGSQTAGIVATCSLVVFLAYGGARILGDGTAVGNSSIQRFLGIFVPAIIAGFMAGRSPATIDAFARVVSVVGTVTGGLAWLEYALGRSAIGLQTRLEAVMRDDSVRAVLGSEHALILAVLLTSFLPFALFNNKPVVRVVQVTAILAGIWATGSRGPVIIAAILIVLYVLGLWHPLIYRRTVIASTIAAAGLAGLWYRATNVWVPYTFSLDWSQNSLEYRPAIYALLPDILNARPLGYGANTMPPGVWLLSAPDRVVDLTVSVDSQLVLGALRFGWLAVIWFVAVAFLGILATRYRQDVGLSLLVVTGSGLFVALDAWDRAGAWWLFLTGAALGVWITQRTGFSGSDIQSGRSNLRVSRIKGV